MSQGEEEMSESAPNFNLGSMSDLGCMYKLSFNGVFTASKKQLFRGHFDWGFRNFYNRKQNLVEKTNWCSSSENNVDTEDDEVVTEPPKPKKHEIRREQNNPDWRTNCSTHRIRPKLPNRSKLVMPSTYFRRGNSQVKYKLSSTSYCSCDWLMNDDDIEAKYQWQPLQEVAERKKVLHTVRSWGSGRSWKCPLMRELDH